jgi:Transposase DDE domain/Transposase DNA-binding
MLNAISDTREWAEDQLASAEFGNVVRARRCAAMLRRAAEHPCGRLTEVFDKGAELEGAYRFVEGQVRPEAIIDAFANATLRGASGLPYVLAVLDGTSLTLTDRGGKKDFGSIGPRRFPTRGLKVIDTIGISPDGVPLGLLDLHFWTRGAKADASKRARRQRGETETQHFREAIDRVAARAVASQVQPWFVIDREGDAAVILRAIDRVSGIFTVRVSQRARRCVAGKQSGSVLQAMARRPVAGTHFVDVPRNAKHQARTAAMDVRWGRVELDLHEHGVRRSRLPTYVVWVRERRAPRGQERLDWMLYTNRDISTYADAIAVVESYCHRWRVEEFHRSWKRGHCRVEDTQLRQRDHVVRWATMLATVALRVERLKHLARTRPDEPATIGLSEIEVEALRVAKRERFTKRTETVGDEMPTISTAVLWIGQFGGFHGRGTAKPGSTTLGRGLERLLVFAAGFERGVKMARKRG